MNRARFVPTLAALILAGACNREEAKPAAKSDSDAMADMPGMGGKSPDSAKVSGAPAGTLATSVTLTPAQIQHGGIKWATVSMGNASSSATVPGELTPNEDRTVRLGAPASGRVVSVAVRPGDRVVAGQPLVTMQSPAAGAAQSDVSKAEAEVGARRAEAQYAASAKSRADRLLALKAIPRQEYERALADDERARAALAQAESEVRRARATAEQLSAGAASSGEIVVRAPAAGVVLARTAVPGTVVEAGAPLVVVTDAASLWLTINAPEQLAGLFRTGGRLRFTTSAFPRETFSATIDAVGAGLEPETRTLTVRAAVVGNGRLKPQMLATVTVEGAGAVPVAFVPEESIQLLQGKPHVFLAHPDGKGGARFDRREVTVGARAEGRVAVLSGLSAGDVVAAAGAFAVKSEFQKATMQKMEM